MLNEKWQKTHSSLFIALGQGIAKGKKYRDLIIRDTSAFSKFTGKYLHPQLLQACTELAISQCLSGIQEICVSEKSNGRNYTFLEIQAEDFYMTVSRVRRCHKVPRNAWFRCVRAMSNQPYLFTEQENRPIDKPYLILVHGITTKKHEGAIVFEELFGGIGMPNADISTQWNKFVLLNDYINLSPDVPDETIDEQNPAFLKLKRNFSGNSDDIA